MLKEVMNDLWLARISSLANEVGLYVVLLEVLQFMPNSLVRHSFEKYDKYDKYVIVPVDKASNNIVFVCKSYYFECLTKELGINSNTSSNTTLLSLSTFWHNLQQHP
jgi:hypothetical protein